MGMEREMVLVMANEMVCCGDGGGNGECCVDGDGDGDGDGECCRDGDGDGDGDGCVFSYIMSYGFYNSSCSSS